MKIKVGNIACDFKPDHQVFPILELVQSVQEIGMRVPIEVWQNTPNTYVLVHGYRRLLAHKILGLQEIEANILLAPYLTAAFKEFDNADVPAST